MLGLILGFLMLFQQTGKVNQQGVSGGYLLRNYTVEDGLPLNSVGDLVQDKNGYLYIATLNGLVRYDGYEFRTFNTSNSPGIATDRFSGMTISPKGIIWLVTETGSLTRYDGRQFSTYGHNNELSWRLRNIDIAADGKLWLSTTHGLAWYDEAGDSIAFVSHPELETDISDVFPDPHTPEKLIGVGSNGLFRYERGLFHNLLAANNFPLGKNNTVAVKQLSDGTVWVITNAGAFSFDPESQSVHQVLFPDRADQVVWNVYEVSDTIILSTSFGYYQAERGHYAFSKMEIEVEVSLNRPNTLVQKDGELYFFGNDVVMNGNRIFKTSGVGTGFVDREGSIWVSTQNQGLFQIRKTIINNITSEQYPEFENIYSVIQDRNGAMWTAGFSNGVLRINNNNTQNWTEADGSLPFGRARFLYEDIDGTIYMSPWNEGLWRLAGDAWEPIPELDQLFGDIPYRVEGMLRASNGDLFIGSNMHTVVKQQDRYRTLRQVYGVDMDAVRVIRETPDGSILLGSNGYGLGILNRKETSLTILTNQSGLSSNFIRDVYVQSSDTLWIATQDNGLNRVILNTNNELVKSFHFNTEDGLLDNSLHRIIPDRAGNFWISTNRGIMQISVSELNHYADGTTEYLPVIKYNQRDGMINQEANGGVQTAGVLTRSNTLWFPNQMGVTVFDLNKAEQENLGVLGTISPVIEYLSLSDSALSALGVSSLALPKDARNFSIKFTAPSFAYPERIVFEYRLLGFDDDWKVANQAREATFTNLNPGKYTFEVRTVLQDGSHSSASISLQIPPYFYETSLFVALVLLVLIGFGIMIYRARVYQLKQRERILEERVREQTRALELAAEQKSRFFAGITHELKTPLSLILSPLDTYLEQRHSDSGEILNTNAVMMHRNGYRLKNLVDQILDVSKLNADALTLCLRPFDIEKFTKQVCGQFQSLLNQKKLTLHVHSEKVRDKIYLDKDSWERILINLISNAIKYSEGADISIYITDAGDAVNVSVKDEGIGIPPKELDKIFDYLYQVEGNRAAEGTGIGLFLVKGLVEQMGGSVRVESEVGVGTEFYITLQKGYAHFQPPHTIVHETPPDEEYTEEASFVAIEPTPRESGNIPSSELILIVEDNDDFREHLSATLSGSFTVLTAKNGREGLDMLTQKTPDLVISDVMMPVMGGFEFVERLRQIEHLQRIPVIFLSARDSDLDINKGLSTGADIYLTKPIRSSSLLSQIEAVMRRERILKDAPTTGSDQESEPELVSQIRTLIIRQMANPSLNMDTLADALFMSRSTLYREWKQISEISVTDFIRTLRFEEARILISEKGFSIQNAALAVGFTDANNFSTSFKKAFGFPPSELIK